jgi:aspartyl-tRNA(Asn)/glutamyl-tRNA(Gln) amidotransferase subunit A
MSKGYTIASAMDALNSKKISSVELTSFYLDKISKQNPLLKAYITVCGDYAMELAKQSDARRASGVKLGLLDGIPLGIKDAFCTKGVRTTMGSKMLENFVPQYESTVTQRLLDQGAVILGKLNMDEFAMGSTGKSSYFGQSLSPLTLDGQNLMAGGSSSGSASAVCADLCVAATGTDTGGSVRLPAAFTGTVGFKPSYGTISRYGMIAYSSSFDQCGFLTKNIYDSALLTYITAGRDGKDGTLHDAPKPSYHNQNLQDLKGITIGVSDDFFANGEVDPQIKQSYLDTIKKFESLGARIQNVALSHVKYSLNAYYFITTAEASSNLARYDGIRYGYASDAAASSYEEFISQNRAEGFGREVKNRILIGTSVLLKDSYKDNYERILKIRSLVRNDYDAAFVNTDAIFLPVSPILTPKADYKMTQLEEYMCDIFTVSVNVAGLGAVSFPSSTSQDGRPINMQLIAKPFEDKTILNIAQLLESCR